MTTRASKGRCRSKLTFGSVAKVCSSLSKKRSVPCSCRRHGRGCQRLEGHFRCVSQRERRRTGNSICGAIREAVRESRRGFAERSGKCADLSFFSFRASQTSADDERFGAAGASFRRGETTNAGSRHIPERNECGESLHRRAFAGNGGMGVEAVSGHGTAQSHERSKRGQELTHKITDLILALSPDGSNIFWVGETAVAWIDNTPAMMSITGIIRSTTPGRYTVLVSSVTLPSGKTVKLSPSRNKVVLLPKTVMVPKSIKVGTRVTVRGQDAGKGTPLIASAIKSE